MAGVVAAASIISDITFLQNGSLYLALEGGRSYCETSLEFILSAAEDNITVSFNHTVSSDTIVESDLFELHLFPGRPYTIQIILNGSFIIYNDTVVYQRSVYNTFSPLICFKDAILIKMVRFPLHYVVFPPNRMPHAKYPLPNPNIRNSQLNDKRTSIFTQVININNPSELYVILKTRQRGDANITGFTLTYFTNVTVNYLIPEGGCVCTYNYTLDTLHDANISVKCIRVDTTPPNPPFIAIHRDGTSLLLAKEILPGTCFGAFSGPYFKSYSLDYANRFYRQEHGNCMVYPIT